MARPLRFVYPGAFYHLMARGDGGKMIFIEKADHLSFLHGLSSVCGSRGWRVHAWGLVGNYDKKTGLFSDSYLPSSNLLSALTGPIHTVTNTWEPNRDVLGIKQNKVGSTVISNYDYAVNAIGQRTGVTTSGTAFPAVPSWLWSYDTLGQVIAADSSVNTSDRAYEYDTTGNRQKSANSLTLPVANNYATKGTNAYSSVQLPGTAAALIPAYDFDGNATAYPLPNAPAANSTLGWDAENRLISTLVSGVTTTYQYDAKSRRIAKVAGNTTTSAAAIYLYDAWNSIAEYSRSAGVSPTFTLNKTRLWGTDLSGTMQGAGGVGGLLLITDHSALLTSHSPTYDGNGNISEYLTATGTLAAHFEYDPFGNTVVNTDTANLFTYRFSTKPRDQETGLYYYGYRYYDPMTGRWPSRDPIEEQGGVNLYGFVGNDGVDKFDVLGLFLDYYTHWLGRSAADLPESFSTFDKGWKADDFPDYAKAKVDICTTKSRVPINITIQVDFGATTIGVGDVRLIGTINYNSVTKRWTFIGGHISIDDNFYVFNKA
jgi:RHS repeat-associated protein